MSGILWKSIARRKWSPDNNLAILSSDTCRYGHERKIIVTFQRFER